MKLKYSTKQFDGFTHRFVVQFETGEPYHYILNIYSNSDNYMNLRDFIEQKKSEKVLSFKINYKISKQEDEIYAKHINEILIDDDINDDDSNNLLAKAKQMNLKQQYDHTILNAMEMYAKQKIDEYKKLNNKYLS